MMYNRQVKKYNVMKNNMTNHLRSLNLLPSDAADSDERGLFGDNHVPRVYGDWTQEEEF